MKTINVIALTLFLAGCGIFKPLGEIPTAVITQGSTSTSTPTPIVGSPSTGIQTTDIVEYVNIVTGETSHGPSIGGYLDNHPDWEQVPMNGVL
jgi:hypothetical protein